MDVISVVEHAVGVDVGGTSTRAVAINSSGDVLAAWAGPTASARRPSVVSTIRDAIEQVTVDAQIATRENCSLGIALPGILDPSRRHVRRSINLPSLEHRDLTVELAISSTHQCRLFTDAEAATWGSYSHCSDQVCSFVHLRIGTGVACGAVVNGQLQPTDLLRDQHLDVLIADSSADAPQCECGKRGCLETIASGPVIARRAEEMGYPEGLASLQRGFERGEDKAVRLIAEIGLAIGCVCARLVDFHDAMRITLGGGVFEALPCLVEQIIGEHDRARSGSSSTLDLTICTSGELVGAIGAARLVLDG